MIAIITSTLQPGTSKSYFNFDDRLAQTKLTLSKLQPFNFQKILLFDNSATLNQDQLNNLLSDFPSVEKYHRPQYQFKNKGINEALLLLNNIHHIPAGVPIFKISGRYYPTENFKPIDATMLNRHDFIGVGVGFESKNPSFSTRAYFVKDKDILEQTLNTAIEEMLAYSNGIHGVKSFINAIKNYLTPRVGTHFYISMEQAFARILKYKKSYLLIDAIHIEGYIAGSDFADLIKE